METGLQGLQASVGWALKGLGLPAPPACGQPGPTAPPQLGISASQSPSPTLLSPCALARPGDPALSGSLYDLVVFGKEKLHLFHGDGEGGGGAGAFSGRRQTLLSLSLSGWETHAGDTEETDEASVLETLESSELSSTFFPKSCKMQFRNWQDRKGYSAEQAGPRR